MTITVTDKYYYPGKYIVNITDADTELAKNLNSEYFDPDGTYISVYPASKEEFLQLDKAVGMDGYITIDDKPEVYNVVSACIAPDGSECLRVFLFKLVPAEPEYDRMTQYVIDHVGSVEKIGDFRFWMPVERYEDLLFIKAGTGDYLLAECRISTDEAISTHLLGRGRYDYKCRVVPVSGALSASGRLMYADDLYSDFAAGSAMPVEEGDTLEYVDIERPLAGGFVERSMALLFATQTETLSSRINL